MNSSNIAIKATSLKLPAALKTQLESDAQRAGLSLHAFMVQTLADSVRRSRLRDAFLQDSLTALSDMKTSQSGYELGNVRAYFSDLASHRNRMRPPSRHSSTTDAATATSPKIVGSKPSKSTLLSEINGVVFEKTITTRPSHA